MLTATPTIAKPTRLLYPLRLPLCMAIAAILCPMPSWAADDTVGMASTPDDDLHEMTIYADPLRRSVSQLGAAVSSVGQQQILSQSGFNLGDALEGQVGVHVDRFGAGAARPVIRGQSAPRVKVLSDGVQLFDASEISPDHAVATDPLLAKRIEVLRGPSTLLYGGGAIGGVVNVIDGKIPEQMPEHGASGVTAVRVDSAALSRELIMAATTALSDHVALHVEGLSRRADDYRAPNQASERVAGTATDGYSGSLGLSWIDQQGFIGVAYSRQASDYALAGHDHAYEGCHLDGVQLHCGDHDDHEADNDHSEEEHAAEAPPKVVLRNDRVDLRGEYRQPMQGIEAVRVRAGYTNYQHQEIEEGQVSTTFANEGVEGRVEITHTPIAGWTGVVGMQHAQNQFSAIGEERFLPVTDTTSHSLFVLEHRDLGEQWHLELGARQEWQQIQADQLDPNTGRRQAEVDQNAQSFSLATRWQFVPHSTLGLTFSRSQRLPNAQELYANGVHVATNTYEQGNANLKAETTQHAELSLSHHAGPLKLNLSGFYSQADDYIYAQTLDRFEDFRLIEYQQHDARFYGGEVEASYRLTPLLTSTVFADHVRGQLRHDDADQNLPRIPATRFGARLQQKWNGFDGELEWYRVNAQREIASFEQVTPAYQMLNASLRYTKTLANTRDTYSVFVTGNNLLNEEAYEHSSFLANRVPLVGRNLTFGVQLSY